MSSSEASHVEPAEKKQKIADEPTPYVLYSYWRSGASWRTRIALNLKEAPFEYKAIHLVKGEQHSAEYVKINPNHRVPSLVLPNGHSISQSLAIIQYLDRVHPDKAPLFPTDPYKLAKAIQLFCIISEDTQPIQNLAVISRVEKITNSADEKLKWAQWALQNGSAALEAACQETHGDYLVGNEVTVADLVLLPHLYSCRRFEVDVSAYPTLLKIEENLNKLPAFANAHPDKQPDAQK